MKKNILLLLIAAIIFAGKTYANKVTSDSAQIIAVNFYKLNSNKSVASVSLAYTKTSEEGNALYYVFNINSNDGFVIVAADDGSYPIIGYNDKGHYDASNLPPNFTGWMNFQARQLADIENRHLAATAAITAEWTAYKNAQPSRSRSSSRTTNAVLPLSNVIWNQPSPFNAMCPGGCVTGCCATAQAQIMRYWNYPLHGLLSNTYNENTPQYTNDYGVISRNFYVDTFQWANMPDTLTVANADVALLMYDCGVSIDMNYGAGGSNAEVICPNSFSNAAADSVCNQSSYVKFFGYNRHTIQGYYRAQFSDSAWQAMMENELNNGRIIQYTGGGDIGHTWLCEGYDSNSMFYMNWGWGSAANGYFPLDTLNPYSFNFDSAQQACIGIEPPAACAQFYANNVSVHTGTGVYFKDESLTPTTITSWHWSFPGGTPATSSAQNPLITYNTPGIYNVTLIVDATGGADTMTKANYIIVQPNNDTLPLTETFETDAFPPKGWYLNNPNGWNASNQGYGSIWQLYMAQGGGGFGLSNSCMLFYNFNSGYRGYLVNQPPPPNPLGGQNQQIYTPAYNFSYVVSDSLYFDVAYSPYNAVYSDTLAVYYSLDCGATWNNIYYKGGMELATTATDISTTGDTLGFIPNSSQWRTDYINLPPAVYGQPSVMFSFENRSYWGGQLYIDNITVPKGTTEITTAVNTIHSPAGKVIIYPNPANNNFVVQTTYNGEQLLQVFDVTGKLMLSQNIYTNKTTIDASSLANGIYVVSLKNDDRVENEKLVVVR